MSAKKSNTKNSGMLKEALGILGVLVAAFAVISAVILIPGCDEEPHKAEKQWAKVTDTETGIVYVECAEGYSPTAVGDVVMECADPEHEGKALQFYEIAYTDTEEFIALKEGDVYTVYRAETLPAPNIKSFGSGTARLYMAGANVPIDYFYTKAAAGSDTEADGSEYIAMVINAFNGGGVSSATGDWGDKNNYSIWLSSKDYPGLYYRVEFKIDENGAEYLYDRVTEKLVKAPKALVARIMA